MMGRRRRRKTPSHAAAVKSANRYYGKVVVMLGRPRRVNTIYLSGKLSDRHNIPILEVIVMSLFVVFSSSLKRPEGNRNDIIMVQRRRPSWLSRLSSTMPRTTTSRVDE
jgi:hypothetical protein